VSTALQSINERLKADLAKLKGAVPAVTGRNIGLKGKRFALPSGQSLDGPIEVVIVDFRNSNRYYTAAYNPTALQPPACWAIGSDIESMGPKEGLVGAQSLTCATCTQNKFGSAPNGGKGKACKNNVRIALMPVDAKPDEDPMIITGSPTSLKSWASLVNGLESSGTHYTQVVTEIAFDANLAYPSLVFRAVRPNENLETAWLLRDKAQNMLDAEPAGND
jgi:hypothetical protein